MSTLIKVCDDYFPEYAEKKRAVLADMAKQDDTFMTAERIALYERGLTWLAAHSYDLNDDTMDEMLIAYVAGLEDALK